jgi:hypothetical protein
MSRRENDSQRREREREAERYRRATIHTLEQLEWCIQYLHRIRKESLAEALARNRAKIIDRAQLFR